MGRVKKYSKQHSNKNKGVAKRKRDAEKGHSDSDSEMKSGSEAALTVAKRKQLFKKKDRRDVKKRIKELRAQSLKLKKRNLD
jgi:hypothetical protein